MHACVALLNIIETVFSKPATSSNPVELKSIRQTWTVSRLWRCRSNHSSGTSLSSARDRKSALRKKARGLKTHLHSANGWLQFKGPIPCYLYLCKMCLQQSHEICFSFSKWNPGSVASVLSTLSLRSITMCFPFVKTPCCSCCQCLLSEIDGPAYFTLWHHTVTEFFTFFFFFF